MVLPATLRAMHAVRFCFAWSLLLLALSACSRQPEQAAGPGPSLAPNDGGAVSMRPVAFMLSTSCSQVGLASWYRESRVPRQNLVAAHRSLPLGTSVKVTAIETGRSIVVG